MQANKTFEETSEVIKVRTKDLSEKLEETEGLLLCAYAQTGNLVDAGYVMDYVMESVEDKFPAHADHAKVHEDRSPVDFPV